MGRIFKPKKSKLIHHINVGSGALYADFYFSEKQPEECYLHVHHARKSNLFEFKVTGVPYLYLLESLNQGKTGEIEAYCAMLWRMSQEVYQDQQLCADIVAALNARDTRLMEEGAKRASAVTDTENEADQALMTEIAKEADKRIETESKENGK